jgi:hypothetical protein
MNNSTLTSLQQLIEVEEVNNRLQRNPSLPNLDILITPL